MDKIKIGVGVVVLILLVVGTMIFWPSDGRDGNDGRDGVGALAGPDIPYQYLKWGGVTTYNLSQPMSASSSILCALKNTTGATTTIDRITSIVTGSSVSGTGAMNTETHLLSVATSTSNHGTSSVAFIFEAQVTGSTNWMKNWSPTWATSTHNGSDVATSTWRGQRISSQDGSDPQLFLKPNEYINWKIATSTAGLFDAYFKGSCSATLRSIDAL